MTRVAEKTGLERTHLYRKLRQLGVDLARGRVDSMQRQGIAWPRRLGAVRVPRQGVAQVRHRDVAPLPR